MKSKISCAPLFGVVLLASPVMAQDTAGTAPGVVGHVTVPVPKQPLEGTAIERTSVHAQGGRTITMQMIAPPVLPDAPAPDLAVSAAAAQAFHASRVEGPPRRTLGLTATIYDHQKTYLEWTFNGEKFAAWSNVDFNYLAQIGDVPTEQNVFMMMMFPVNANTAALATLAERRGKTYQPPTIPAFATDEPSFVIVSGDASNAAALAPIASLHQIYKTNSARLKADYQQHLADAAAQAAYDQAHPKQPTNTVVQFWKRDVPATPANVQQEGSR